MKNFENMQAIFIGMKKMRRNAIWMMLTSKNVFDIFNYVTLLKVEWPARCRKIHK